MSVDNVQPRVISDEAGNGIFRSFNDCPKDDPAELARRWNSQPDLLEACKFAKAQIKKGSQKKALPILREAIAAAEPGGS